MGIITQEDLVNHPKHYTSSQAKCVCCDMTIECIDITRHLNFNIGNAIKYIWRSDHKGKKIEDLKKAIWYLQDEINTLTSQGETNEESTQGSNKERPQSNEKGNRKKGSKGRR